MADSKTSANPDQSAGVKPRYVHEPLPKPLPNVQHIRHRRNLRNLILITLPLLVIAGAAGYMASPWSKVADITVKGTQVVANQDVIDATKMTTKTYIPAVVLNHKTIAKQVQSTIPALKTVAVKVEGARDITLKVSEFTTVGYVSKDGSNHAVLSNGTILRRESAQPEQGLPLFTGFNQDLKSIIEEVAKVPPAIRQDISEVSATRGNGNPYQVTLTMNDGNTVVADSRTLAKKIKYYPNIVGQVKGKGTVDLEVGAYFEPKSRK